MRVYGPDAPESEQSYRDSSDKQKKIQNPIDKTAVSEETKEVKKETKVEAKKSPKKEAKKKFIKRKK